MKTYLLSSAVFLACTTLASAGSPSFQAFVTADAPAAAAAQTYVAYDAGYIEGGDSIAGEKPPAPEAVRAALGRALQTAGLAPAAAGAAPAALLLYHWGAIEHDSTPPARSFRIQPNLRARIALVASAATVRRAEDFFVGPRPVYVEPDLRDAFELARGRHYFVIVSAYDRAALDRHEAKLLWRVRLSTLANAGAMDAVVPALAAAAGPYVARDLARPAHIRIPRTGGVADAANVAPAAPTGELDDFVRRLAHHEHEVFSGDADPTDS